MGHWERADQRNKARKVQQDFINALQSQLQSTHGLQQVQDKDGNHAWDLNAGGAKLLTVVPNNRSTDLVIVAALPRARFRAEDSYCTLAVRVKNGVPAAIDDFNLWIENEANEYWTRAAELNRQYAEQQSAAERSLERWGRSLLAAGFTQTSWRKNEFRGPEGFGDVTINENSSALEFRYLKNEELEAILSKLLVDGFALEAE